MAYRAEELANANFTAERINWNFATASSRGRVYIWYMYIKYEFLWIVFFSTFLSLCSGDVCAAGYAYFEECIDGETASADPLMDVFFFSHYNLSCLFGLNYAAIFKYRQWDDCIGWVKLRYVVRCSFYGRLAAVWSNTCCWHCKLRN